MRVGHVGGKEKGGRGGTVGPPTGQHGKGKKKRKAAGRAKPGRKRKRGWARTWGWPENGRKVNFSKTTLFPNLFFNSKPNSNGI